MPDDSSSRSDIEVEEAEWRDPANWYAGPLGLYYSRRDPRAFVPKRRRALGVTINFARPLGIAFLVGIVLVIVAVTVVTRGARG